MSAKRYLFSACKTPQTSFQCVLSDTISKAISSVVFSVLSLFIFTANVSLFFLWAGGGGFIATMVWLVGIALVALKLPPIYEIFDLKYDIVAYSVLIALSLLMICFSYLKTHKDPFHCNSCICDTLGLKKALCNWSANVRNSPILDYAHPLDYSIHRRRRTCRTALRQLAERCEFESITPNQILREKLEFGIRDSKGRERLLRKNNLSLQKTDEICCSHETMVQQMKVVGDVGLSVADVGTLNALSREAKRGRRRRGRGSRNTGARENNIVVRFADVSIV